MTEQQKTALLPAGLRDLLPHEAEQEASLIATAMRRITRHGYLRVKPPLVEFEGSLNAYSHGQNGNHAFRVLDPHSQAMMAVRADMTPQIARIAQSRLAHQPRPLRLGYQGQILRVSGSQLRPDRQFTQVGAEMIGADCAEADAEVISVAVLALKDTGLSRLSVDLNIPGGVSQLLPAGQEPALLLQALEHKDIGSLQRLCGHDHLLVRLAQAAGPAPAAFAALAALDLPAAFAGWVQRLERITACLQGMLPEISITVDPIEQRGFEYHEGVGFSIFAPGAQIELGRGGRYITAGDPTEVATGATLFMDVWRTLVPVPAAPKTIMVPHQTSAPALDALHQAGYVTIAALADTAPLRQQAAACGCVAVYENGQAKTL